METKVEYKVEQGKVIVDAKIGYALDQDADSKPSITASSVNHIELDTYELVTEIMKKDSPVLELVLKQMNYKPAGA